MAATQAANDDFVPVLFHPAQQPSHLQQVRDGPGAKVGEVERQDALTGPRVERRQQLGLEVHRHPLAILEVRRILLEHVNAVNSPAAFAAVHPVSNMGPAFVPVR